MIKAILWDGDGVVVNKPEIFSQVYSREHNVPMYDVLPFFKNEFQLCLVGQADLKEQIKPYLIKWGWSNSVEEFLDYWFKTEDYLNHDLLNEIIKLRQSGIKCYFCTNQEKYRTEYMLRNMSLADYFDQTFSSAYLGYKKPNQEFWQKIFGLIKSVDKTEVLVIDDDKEVVDSALEFGFWAEFYGADNDYKKILDKYC